MKKILSIVILVVVVAAGGSFYGGMHYERGTTGGGNGGRNLANLSPEARQARMAQFGGLAGGRGGRGGGSQPAGGFVAGEIIAKDDKSLTIKLPENRSDNNGQAGDGGSKIIFFADSTSINKTVGGSEADFNIGGQVTANGTANPDGSISAQSIQIRTEAPNNSQK